MRSFGHLERDVMRVIWRAEQPVTGHDIAAQLPSGRDIAYTTLITVVHRLRDKGLLTRFRDGRSFRYQAALTEEEYAADLMAQALNSSDDRSRALLHFAGPMCTAAPGTASAGASWTGGTPALRIKRLLTTGATRPRILLRSALVGAALVIPVTPSVAAVAPVLSVVNTETAPASHHNEAAFTSDFDHHP